jgi:MraZ protein
VFLGTYTPRLDDKGRVALPAKYRDVLADGVVITPGQEHCLFVFSRDGFADRFASLVAAPVGSRKARDATRLLAAAAHDDVPDKQGRVTLPAKLREYAGLARDLVVVGAMSRLEIWEPTAWAAYQAANEADFASLDEGVLDDLF